MRDEPEIRTVPRPTCFLCGTEGVALYRNLVDRLFGSPGTWNLKVCADCGLLWLDPTPRAEDLALAYKSYFTHEEDQSTTRAGRVRRVLYQVYQGISAVPATFAGLHRAKVDLHHMFLTDLPPGKVLDVGCGDGTFLNRMSRLGWSVEGIDVDPQAIERAKLRFGLKLLQSDLHTIGFPENHFDAITLSHVIEHVPDPIRVLQEVKRIIKPDGRLVVSTPNAAGLGHKTFQASWWGLDPPRHLQIFNVDALRRLARQIGFDKVRAFGTAANADIFIGGSYSIKASADQRINYEPAPNLRRTLRAVFAQYKEHVQLGNHTEAGEEAVLICERKR